MVLDQMDFKQKAEEKKMSMSKNIARLAVTAGLTAALSFGGVMAPVTMAIAAESGTTATANSITINKINGNENVKYKAYQIFKAKVTDVKSSGKTVQDVKWANKTIGAKVINAITNWSGYSSLSTENQLPLKPTAADVADWLIKNVDNTFASSADGATKGTRVAPGDVLYAIANVVKEETPAGTNIQPGGEWTPTASGNGYYLFVTDGLDQAKPDTGTSPIFAIVGGIGGTYQGGEIDAVSNPATLVMLFPVVVMLVVSTKTRNIYAGIGVGLSLGTVVGLAAGLFTFGDVFANDAANSAAVGFLIDGVNGILPTCALVISVFGIMGVLNDAGMLDYLADSILQSKAASTERGAELICMLGISLTTILFGGVTSASILTFGPILNRIGSAKNIHPYRRANLLDGTANSLPAIVPFMSVFVFIGAALTGLSPVEVAGGTVYAFALFGTFLVAVITGWGRKHEDEPAKK